MPAELESLQTLIEETKPTFPDSIVITNQNIDICLSTQPKVSSISRFTPKSPNLTSREQNQFIKTLTKHTPIIPTNPCLLPPNIR